MAGRGESLVLRESVLADDAARVLAFLEQQGTFRFPTLESGLFSAAAGEGDDFELTGYRSVWVRDNIHIANAHWVWNDAPKAAGALQALMSYFTKFRFRFTDAIEGRSDPRDPMFRPHIRFDGTHLTEVDEKWSHAQNDALGAFLWLYSNYCRWRSPGTPTAEEWELLCECVAFLQQIQYWQDEDSGHWEEVRKVAASSIGVVVAGLKAFRQHLFTETRFGGPPADFSYLKYGRPISLNDVNDLMDRGEQALAAILPAECAQSDAAKQRHYDAALLFLIYPYRVVSPQMADRIVSNVTTHLMGDHGIRRYNGDSYWCADYREKLAADQRTVDFSDNLASRDSLLERGLEAQWCLFDPIVSIHYGLRYKESGEIEDRRRQIFHLQRSLDQVTRPGGRAVPYRCPESYFCEKGRYVPNDICPLLWTQANLKQALWLASGHPL
jgi:phosphorylase kinase alpha/beta subunit